MVLTLLLLAIAGGVGFVFRDSLMAMVRTEDVATYGTLDLLVVPDAKVFVDGRYVGDTPIEGFKLSAGPHRLRLVNPDRGLSKTLRVTIRAGRTVSKIIQLAK